MKNRKKRIQLSIDEETLNRVKALAQKENRSTSNQIETMLRKMLDS